MCELQHKANKHNKIFEKINNKNNGIENFWNQNEHVLRKHNEAPKESLPLFLKRGMVRSNFGTPKPQLKTLKEWTDILCKSTRVPCVNHKSHP